MQQAPGVAKISNVRKYVLSILWSQCKPSFCDDSETHLTVQSGPKYIGVILAICCTIAGSLNNIVIKRYQALSR